MSENVEKNLNDIGIKNTRIAGKNRYETSVKVAELLGTDNGVVVASAQNFPDALSMAPIAAKKGMPIILSEKDYLSESVLNYVNGKVISKTYIIGGDGAISEKVMSQFPNTQRLAGADRYETNIKIIQEFKTEVDLNSIYVASGDDFPDALSGSALAPKENAPIVLVGNTLSKVTKKFMNFQSIPNVTLLGGIGAINESTNTQIESLMKSVSSGESIVDFYRQFITYPSYYLYIYDTVFRFNRFNTDPFCTLNDHFFAITDKKGVNGLDMTITLVRRDEGMEKELFKRILPTKYNEFQQILKNPKAEKLNMDGRDIEISLFINTGIDGYPVGVSIDFGPIAKGSGIENEITEVRAEDIINSLGVVNKNANLVPNGELTMGSIDYIPQELRGKTVYTFIEKIDKNELAMYYVTKEEVVYKTIYPEISKWVKIK